MTSPLEPFIRRLHAQPIRVVLAVTGGGSRAIADLLEVPGGSRILAEAVVPYSAAALSDWLGAAPEKFCDPHTARLMAMRAFERAKHLEGKEAVQRFVGLACTASLASEPPKKGPHRAHVAWQTLATTATASLELQKGRRTRQEEETLIAHLILNQLAEACEIEERIPLDLLEGKTVETSRTDAPREWQAILSGQTAAVRNGAADARGELAVGRAIFPGAFNPLHAGHLRMAEVAAEILSRPVDFELSVTNVDKPPLDYTEMSSRAGQFSPAQTLWFTRAPTFAEKAVLFPDGTFVVGADTIVRIADPKYYGGDERRRDQALAQIAQAGCRFLVFGRVYGNRFQSLSELVLPSELWVLCTEVPEDQFRLDISSTALRQHAEATEIGP